MNSVLISQNSNVSSRHLVHGVTYFTRLQSRPKMTNSTVVDPKTGERVPSEVRQPSVSLL